MTEVFKTIGIWLLVLLSIFIVRHCTENIMRDMVNLSPEEQLEKDAREIIPSYHEDMKDMAGVIEESLPFKISEYAVMTNVAYVPLNFQKHPHNFGYQGRIFYRYELFCNIELVSKTEFSMIWRPDLLKIYCHEDGPGNSEKIPETFWPYLRGTAASYVYDYCKWEKPLIIKLEPRDCEGVEEISDFLESMTPEERVRAKEYINSLKENFDTKREESERRKTNSNPRRKRKR